MVVLVAVDGKRRSDPALSVGATVAEGLGTELVALHVMPQSRYERVHASRADAGPRSLDFAVYPTRTGEGTDGRKRPNPYPIDAAQEDATAAARAVVEATLGARNAAVAQGRVGEPTDQIAAEADRRDADYLVVGGRKRTSVGKAVFGSVTQSVLLEAKGPVITVPNEGLAEARDGPVVAAVDRSDRATRVIDEADRLAGALERPLHAVHVAHENDPRGLLGTDEPPSDPDLRGAAAEVAEAAAGDPQSELTCVGLLGEPAGSLLTYAAAQDAAALVTAGRKRSPVGKVLFGSVTQSVLLGTDRPVLAAMVDG